MGGSWVLKVTPKGRLLAGVGLAPHRQGGAPQSRRGAGGGPEGSVGLGVSPLACRLLVTLLKILA